MYTALLKTPILQSVVVYSSRKLFHWWSVLQTAHRRSNYFVSIQFFYFLSYILIFWIVSFERENILGYTR